MWSRKFFETPGCRLRIWKFFSITRTIFSHSRSEQFCNKIPFLTPFPYNWLRNIWMVPLWFLMEFLVKVLSQISQTTEILEYLCETTWVTSFLWVRKDLLHSGHLCSNFPVWSLPRVCKIMSYEESKFFFTRADMAVENITIRTPS